MLSFGLDSLLSVGLIKVVYYITVFVDYTTILYVLLLLLLLLDYTFLVSISCNYNQNQNQNVNV